MIEPITIRDLDAKIVQTISVVNNPGCSGPVTIWPTRTGNSLIVIEVEKMDNLDYIEALAKEKGLV